MNTIHQFTGYRLLLFSRAKTCIHYMLIALVAATAASMNCSNMVAGYMDNDRMAASSLHGQLFAINSDTPYAYTTSVVLNINAGSATEMRFRNMPDDWSEWEAYSEIKNWMLVYGNGTKTVEGEFRDSTGSVITMSDSIVFIDRITAMDGRSDHKFGSSVAISSDGNIVAVGVPAYNSNRGAVYVYYFNGSGWEPIQILSNAADSEARAGDALGYSVTISGDGNYITAGAPGFNNSRGAAYLFKKDYSGPGEWGLRAKIVATGGVLNDRFGYSVGVSYNGSVIISGSPWSGRAGRVFVFRQNDSSWIEDATLAASDGIENDQFGCAVSISADGNTIAAGAMEHRVGTSQAQGAAYLYRRDGASWHETAFTASNGRAEDYFGSSVSISADGNTVCVGAYEHDGTGGLYGLGCAYMYVRVDGTWSEARLIAPDGADNDYFGRCVSISPDGSILAVGAWGHATGAGRTGSVYMFERDPGGVGAWYPIVALSAPDGAPGDQFGFTVAVSSEGSVITGAIEDDTGPGENQGSVYVFKNSF